MRKLIISLCLSACCSLLAAQNTNPIQEAMANYDYETALSLIEQEIPTVPLLFQKGKALKGLGDNGKALLVFQEIAMQDSLNPRAYIEAAECCKSLAKYREALTYYQNALKLNPDNKYVRLQYISMLMSMKRYNESLQESNALAEKDSSAFVLHLRAESMGHVYDNTQIMQVIEAYQDIQRRYPEDYLSAAKLGNIYVAGGQFEDAIETTENIAPSIPPTSLSTGSMHRLTVWTKTIQKPYRDTNNCCRKRTAASRPAFMQESATMPSKTFTRHMTCWKERSRMTVPISTYSITWDVPAPRPHGKRKA